jgi:hypothetical protein
MTDSKNDSLGVQEILLQKHRTKIHYITLKPEARRSQLGLSQSLIFFRHSQWKSRIGAFFIDTAVSYNTECTRVTGVILESFFSQGRMTD